MVFRAHEQNGTLFVWGGGVGGAGAIDYPVCPHLDTNKQKPYNLYVMSGKSLRLGPESWSWPGARTPVQYIHTHTD